MDLEEFEQEKGLLNLEEALKTVIEQINNSKLSLALNILEPLRKKYEEGHQVENDNEQCYYSFSDNIEYFTTLIEASQIENFPNINILSPNYSRMYHILGFLYSELKKSDIAIKYLEKALELNPVSSGTYLELAEIYKKERDWENFLPIAEKAILYAKTPITFARALRSLGYYFCEIGNYNLSTALYMHSLIFDEKKEIVGNEISYMYEKTNKQLDMPSPDDAIKIIAENNLQFEISNQVCAGYAEFIKAIKEYDKEAYNLHKDILNKLVISEEKKTYLKQSLGE